MSWFLIGSVIKQQIRTSLGTKQKRSIYLKWLQSIVFQSEVQERDL